jgi:hypothetical protein
MSNIVPYLLVNVPSDPFGSPQFATTTTTTTTIPPTLNLVSTPKNSGITDFSNFNNYIHYLKPPGAQNNIQIQPSSLLIAWNGAVFHQFSWLSRKIPKTSGVSSGQINDFKPIRPAPPPGQQIDDF